MSERFDDAPRLGPGTSFDGVLSFDGALRVDGLVAGTVQAEAGCLIVGAQGRVNARVAVGELVLAGVLIGDVIAQRRVELLPGAQLEGNVTAPLLDFCLAFVVLIAMMLFYGIMPGWKFLLVPPLMAIAALLALSIGLWLAPINARFRDIKHTLPFLIQVWMYASPIVYPLSMVPEQWRWAYALNPMVGVIEGFRWAVFDRGEPNLFAIGLSVAVIAVLLFGGLVFFRRMERSFADTI